MLTPSGWAEVIQEAVQLAAMGLHVSMPAKVVAYNASRQTVDVQPQYKRVIENDDPSGEPFEFVDFPSIPDVPIAWPSSLGGTLSITMPMQAGDPVLLVFCDFDHGQYRAKGETTTPGDLRSHGLSGAVAFPGGIRPDGAPIAATNVNADKMVLGGPVMLGAGNLNVAQTGALNGEATDPYTGMAHWQLGNASQQIFVRKT